MVLSVLLPGQTCPTSSWPSPESALTTNPAHILSAQAGEESKLEANLAKARTWLRSYHLLGDEESEEVATRQHKAPSKCKFGLGVDDIAKGKFLRRLIPHEHHLAMKQMDIGNGKDPKYHYQLRLNNVTPVCAKPMRLRPQEEAWWDIHLDELIAKGVIGPILPHQQPRYVTPLLLVPGK
jgi:hypothetical protein